MIGPRGEKILKEEEGYRDKAYLCPAGVWTIGWGSTHGVKEGDTCTVAEAEARLVQDIVACEATISYQVTVPLTDSMRDALLDWVFNLGGSMFRISTLRKRLNSLDYAGVPHEIRRWTKAKNTATGKLEELPGLVRRREREAELFLADGLPEQGGKDADLGS